jgi:hypothetical protein
MQVWTCYIISMPSGGLVTNHNPNQCITSTLGWRKFTVSTLLGRLHCPRPRPLKQRAVPRQTRAPRTAGVRAAACRAQVRARRPCPHCPRRVRRAARGHAPVFPLHSSLRRQEGARPAIKVACCRAQADEPPASAIEGSHSELRVRPATHQIELSSTSPCTYSSSPTVPSHRRATHLTGADAPAAGTGRRRGTPSPGVPPPPTPAQIGS